MASTNRIKDGGIESKPKNLDTQTKQRGEEHYGGLVRCFSTPRLNGWGS